MLKTGLYEQVINQWMAAELARTDKVAKAAPIDAAESAKILAKYLAEVFASSLDRYQDGETGLADQILLVNKLVAWLRQETQEPEMAGFAVPTPGKQLLALRERENNLLAIGERTEVVRPQSSLAISSLFTGAGNEPSLYSELKKEIASCDRIDLLVSFIKWSGLRMLMEELREFSRNGGRLRVITTSYMGATDVKAIEELRKLAHCEIKISYETKRTRLHAKTYVFYRETGFTTAYVGSSNLSNAAISSGLEWNVKVTAKDLPDTIRQIEHTFESYWNSPEFDSYSEQQTYRLAAALKAERTAGTNLPTSFLFDINPYAYQQEILDKLEAERKVRGFYKNLLVAATGTGKTVIAALDYKRFCRENPGQPNRLLFVAHREEILKQSVDCFRGVLKDTNFGDLFVGNYRPERLDALFVSVQTFNAQELEQATSPNYYDYIVVDEFHHAAAPTYQTLLTYYQPQILLGLTATPERMDGKSILDYFDQRIAAEIRLPEAIDRKLLSPFQYYGLTDCVDLDSLRWGRGGYQNSELTNLYAFSEGVARRRAELIAESVHKYVTDIDEVIGLGFCVSKEHARFMAEQFNARQIPSMHLTSESPAEERKNAKNRLVRGELKFLFVVDLYNEGVDIPEINTVLFLRPTESLTVFLQQLGRGLRLSAGKDCLTVLDFIGQAHKKYNFEQKFAALLSNTTHSLQHEIKQGFVSVPKGCFIQLERKAQQYILENIRSSFGVRAGLVSRLQSFEEESGLPLTLPHFAQYYHLDVRKIFERGSFARLCVFAGVRDDFQEDVETELTRALPRLCQIDGPGWLQFLLDYLTRIDELDVTGLTKPQQSMLQMFYLTIWNEAAEDLGAEAVRRNLRRLATAPVMRQELVTLLRYSLDRVDLVAKPVELGFLHSLELHCHYSLRQIATAMEYFNYGALQGLGVKYFKEKKTDVFFITLNKSDKDYSPTTMYNDYSINESLFHWQSQSTTSDTSATGQRYIHHRQTGNQVLLFVRETKKDEFGDAALYTFLGRADYVKHEGGKPMNIVWQLQAPIPAKLIKKTNKLVVG